MTVRVTTACTACGLCLVTCPEGALRPAPGRPVVLDRRCTACLACVEVCPRDAISVVGQAGPPTPPGAVAVVSPPGLLAGTNP